HAKALTHVTAKWPWLAARTPPGVHVLRVSYGRPGDDPGLLDRVGTESALRDAEVLLDVPLGRERVRASRMVRWDGGLPPAGPGLRRDVSTVHEAAERRPGLVVTGAWVAGTGVAAVVADAERAAQAAT
ncbi:hypothetical protein PU560_00670, partial [Georgenia sp. 10Sc9-8]|nr:hypothetical protein [Georgenia halotolerans]